MVESSMAPTSRTIESAVCTESRASCNRLRPVVVRELRRSARHKPPRNRGHAATALTTTEVDTEMPIANATTLQSTAIAPASGNSTGARATSTPAAQIATTSPAAPAAKATTTASATPNRRIRLSVAPRASRIAISPRRRRDLTRNRLPTLAQAINRTAATAPIRIQIACDVRPAYSSAKEPSVIPGSCSPDCRG